jgi:hypothetical protein
MVETPHSDLVGRRVVEVVLEKGLLLLIHMVCLVMIDLPANLAVAAVPNELPDWLAPPEALALGFLV